MTDSHEDEWVARLPEGAFDLMEELARWRELRDVVMPADLVARMDRATAELTARQIVTQVAAVGSRAAGGFMATRSSLAGPDIQFHSGPVLFLDEGLSAPKVHGTAVLLSTLSPTSRGRVSLRSSAQDTAPRILHNYLSTEEDRRSMSAGLRAAMEISAQPSMRTVITGPYDPPASDSDADLLPTPAPKRRRSTAQPRRVRSAPSSTAISPCSDWKACE